MSSRRMPGSFRALGQSRGVAVGRGLGLCHPGECRDLSARSANRAGSPLVEGWACVIPANAGIFPRARPIARGRRWSRAGLVSSRRMPGSLRALGQSRGVAVGRGLGLRHPGECRDLNPRSADRVLRWARSRFVIPANAGISLRARPIARGHRWSRAGLASSRRMPGSLRALGQSRGVTVGRDSLVAFVAAEWGCTPAARTISLTGSASSAGELPHARPHPDGVVPTPLLTCVSAGRASSPVEPCAGRALQAQPASAGRGGRDQPPPA